MSGFETVTEFTDAIEANWPGAEWVLSASCGCDTDDDGERVDCNHAADFSRSECECCGSHLGGSRDGAAAIHREAFGPDAKRPDEVYDLSVCVDCLMLIANGELPDHLAA